MAQYLSADLRVRVIRAVEGGMSRNAAARRFGAQSDLLMRSIEATPDVTLADLRHHQDRAPARPQPARRALPHRRPARPLEDHDVGGESAPRRSHGAHGPRRRDERRGLRRLCQASARPNAAPQQRRRPGQSARPQGQGRQRGDRGRRRTAPVPAATLSGLQSGRAGLRQDQGAPASAPSGRPRPALVSATWPRS